MAKVRGRKEQTAAESNWMLTKKSLVAVIDVLICLLTNLRDWLNPEDDLEGVIENDSGTGRPVMVKSEPGRMHSEPRGKFYAVARGFKPGIYRTWMETAEQVHNFGHALFQKFNTLEEAELFMSGRYDPVLASVELH